MMSAIIFTVLAGVNLVGVIWNVREDNFLMALFNSTVFVGCLGASIVELFGIKNG